MLKTIAATIAFTGLMVASAYPLETQGQRAAAPPPSHQIVRVAASACWYVVLHCKTSKREVERWQQTNGGDVINTSSDEFPNFARGYFCAVIGPLKSKAAAQAESARWREGAAPDAYVKDSGC